MNPEESPDTLVDSVDRLNRKLEEFIHHVCENHEDDPHVYLQFLGDDAAYGNRQRCWEVKNCHLTDCPARTSCDFRCWLVAGTLCGEVVQGEFSQKNRSCFECVFYRSATSSPISALNENITTIVTHFINRTRQLRDMATKDTLTGLFNRHFLNMLAVREEAVVDRSGNPLSLMLIDIDDFKAINDSFGHLAGDKALCDFAGFLREHTRESDYLFRLGGDEFLVLMTGAGEDACTVFGQRLQLQANAWNEARVAMELVSIHFSLGCATAVSPFKLEELLDAADEKMYLNKLQGHHLLARHQAGVAQIR